MNAKGWGLGQANGKVGWFPGDFVEMRPSGSERKRYVGGGSSSYDILSQHVVPNHTQTLTFVGVVGVSVWVCRALALVFDSDHELP